MALEKINLEIPFDTAISLIHMYNYYTPEFTNPDFKGNKYEIRRRIRYSPEIGHICRNGSWGYIQFAENCPKSDKVEIKKALKDDIKRITGYEKKSIPWNSEKRKFNDHYPRNGKTKTSPKKTPRKKK